MSRRRLLMFAGLAVLLAAVPATAGLPGNDRGDFDNDGIADIVWRNIVTGQNGIWFMNGGSVKSTMFTPTMALNWSLDAVGDFNRDGEADLAFHDHGAAPVFPTIIQHLQNGQYLDACAGSGYDMRLSAAADFDGDGDADQVWRNQTTGDLLIRYTLGCNSFEGSAVVQAPGPAWTLAGTGDFNGDGRPDFVYRNDTTGDNAIWLMTAQYHTGPGLPDIVPIESRFTNGLDPAWNLVAIGDYNGDGWSDLVWRNPTTVQNAIWYMNGTSVSWTEFISSSNAEWQIVGPR